MQQYPNSPYRPFVFVLKEGKAIKQNFLDYSLQMLHMQGVEKIESPVTDEPRPGRVGPMMMGLQENLRTAEPKPAPISAEE